RARAAEQERMAGRGPLAERRAARKRCHRTGARDPHVALEVAVLRVARHRETLRVRAEVHVVAWVRRGEVVADMRDRRRDAGAPDADLVLVEEVEIVADPADARLARGHVGYEAEAADDAH